MLYHLHDLGRACIGPMAHLAHAWAALLDAAPLMTPWQRQAGAACALLHRLGKDYAKPAFAIDSVAVDGRTVRVSERIVASRPFCDLLNFRKERCAAQPPVLVVAPLAGHHASLLRDTVRELLKDHDVYVTDWRDARDVPLAHGDFGLDDYVRYLRDFLRRLGPALHVVPVCQSTVPVLAAVAQIASSHAPGLPRSVTLIAGPVDTRRAPTAVNRFATSRSLDWFARAMIHPVPYGHPGAGRRVYPGFIQHACFVSMNPERHAASHRDFFERRCRAEETGRHCAFYDDYNATLDLPARFYLDTIGAVFQDHLLARGVWRVGGQAVRPQDIRNVALFTVEGDRDDITAPGQTAAAHDLCSGISAASKRHYLAPDCGHYATFSGRHWREAIAPRIRDFIRSHAVALQAA